MVKLNNKYIIPIFLTVIVLFSGCCFSCKNNSLMKAGTQTV